MSRYRNDPRRMAAKYAGTDANGRAFAKGESVTYWPATRRILSGDAGAAAWRDFEAAAADECGGGYCGAY